MQKELANYQILLLGGLAWLDPEGTDPASLPPIPLPRATPKSCQKTLATKGINGNGSDSGLSFSLMLPVNTIISSNKVISHEQFLGSSRNNSVATLAM